FWSRVEKTDICWLWKGAIHSNGLGVTSVNGSLVGTHRYSYELSNGTIPNGMNVFHTCTNRHCVNPAHLFLGSKNANQPLIHKKKREEDRFWPKVQKL